MPHMTFEKIHAPRCECASCHAQAAYRDHVPSYDAQVADWSAVKPPGCYCKTLAQAQGCENRCDDSIFEGTPEKQKVPLVIILFVIVMVLTLVFSRGHAEGAPLYCGVLEKFERSCTGVRLATKALGRQRAEWLARKCGATADELDRARECLDRFGCTLKQTDAATGGCK